MTTTLERPSIEAPDAGVIEEARRRQWRFRLAGGVSVVVIGVLAALLAFGSSGGTHSTPPPAPPAAAALPTTWLSGPRLGPTHLRLVASENGGPASIVDVDSGRASPVRDLRLPTTQLLGPRLSLTAVNGGAFAVVTHEACGHCAITEDDFLIDSAGSARHVGTRHFNSLAGTAEHRPVPGTTAEWVLTWPHRGACKLRLVPGSRPATTVPCGDLGQALPSGVVVWTHHGTHALLVNPSTGAVRLGLNPADQYDSAGHDLLIEGPTQGHGTLELVNLTAGTRRSLGWPSRLRFGYQVFPDPAGPYVAIEFADPAYPENSRTGIASDQTIGAASDIWLLNTRSGAVTHVPGFPIFVELKQSGVAWTPDGRLVIAAQGGALDQPTTRTVIGVWRPGERTMTVGRIPSLHGYNEFVALTSR